MLQDRLNNSTRVAFGAGTAPESIKNALWHTFILFYFVQVLGMSGSLAGLAIAIALAWNAIIDPMIGSYSDNLRATALGKRQRLMAWSAVPYCISIVLLFAPPAGLSEMGLFAWLVFWAVIARTAISTYTIPYFALNVELSRNPIERPILTAARSIAGGVSNMFLPLIAFSVFFAATPAFPNGQLNRNAYLPFIITLSVFSFLVMIWVILGTNKRSMALDAHTGLGGHRHVRLSPKMVVLQIADALRSTKNVRYFVLLNVFIFVCLGVVSVYLLHLSTYYWRLPPASISYVAMAAAPGGIIAPLFARYYVPRFDKQRMLVTFIILYAVLIVLPILGPLSPLFPQPGDPLQVPTLVTLKFLGGFVYAAFLTVMGTVVADIADELELNAGAPRQALLSSFTFFTSFAASAVINVSAGAFLDLIAFPVGVAPALVPQAMGAKLAMFSAGTLVVAMAGVVFFLLRFDISAEKQAGINEALEHRYAKARDANDAGLAPAE